MTDVWKWNTYIKAECEKRQPCCRSNANGDVKFQWAVRNDQWKAFASIRTLLHLNDYSKSYSKFQKKEMCFFFLINKVPRLPSWRSPVEVFGTKCSTVDGTFLPHGWKDQRKWILWWGSWFFVCLLWWLVAIGCDKTFHGFADNLVQWNKIDTAQQSRYHNGSMFEEGQIVQQHGKVPIGQLNWSNH